MPTVNKIRLYMGDWLKQNAVALAIGIATFASSYAVYGVRIDNLETRLTSDEATIALDDQESVKIQVTLAEIQTDIEYIKEKVGEGGN